MRLCFYVNPANARLWLEQVGTRLREDLGAEVVVFWSDKRPLPDHVLKLLKHEKRTCHKGTVQLSDPLDTEGTSFDTFDVSISHSARVKLAFDLVIDLVGNGNVPIGDDVVTVRYDGHPGDEALVGAILKRGMPQIAFTNAEGKLVATARPSGELAVGLSGSMDQVYARLSTLLKAYINHPHRGAEPLDEKPVALPSARQLLARTIKVRLKYLVKQGYYRIFRPGHWRIGWRWLADEGVWDRQAMAGERWRILKDEETHFYADPVPWIKDGRHYLFFEDLDENTQKGVISVVAFDEDGNPGPARVCLEEDFHLSYPFLISHQGETYMIPETSANRDIALYKASSFPFGWQRVATLIEGIEAADATITRFEGRWWLFCVTRDGGGYSDCLSIFYADDLFGPWQPHQQNPVLIDVSAARPAGNFVMDGDRLLRPVQECSRSYGAGLKLVEVTRLTPEVYEQKEICLLGPDAHWPGRKLHMLNRAGNLEVIDGAILRPRLSWLRALFDRHFEPRGTEPDAPYKPPREPQGLSEEKPGSVRSYG
ncbi:hypothetical protein [uncultured Cohaesibacter sp.]|uniref:glucosamine inositolphosphorylceramide transferase family protein n=1 Tax=uncultured Cohaesibacter sp. TaxID=1002546 RepID=UPI0029C99452|nr:hypothetical protein [uncultured Cohaesibacter sp.]